LVNVFGPGGGGGGGGGAVPPLLLHCKKVDTNKTANN
jgi:hypothetical protein